MGSAAINTGEGTEMSDELGSVAVDAVTRRTMLKALGGAGRDAW